MGNSTSHVPSTADIVPFFLDDLCTKARSSTLATSVEDFSVCDCAEIETPQRSRHCWGGWFLEKTSIDRLRPSLMSVLDSDQESSCSVDTPQVSLVFSFDLEEEDSIHKLKQHGSVLEQQGKLNEAIGTYQSLLELLRATGGSESLGDIHWRTGVVQWKRGAYSESLRHLDQAMFAYQLRSGGDSTASNMDMCQVLLATGRVHLSMGNRSLAKKCFRHAVDLLKEHGGRDNDDEIQEHIKPLLAKLMLALGTVYQTSGNFDKAVSYCQIALDLQKRSNQEEAKTDLAATMNTFGSLYEEMGDYVLALEHFTEAYHMYKDLAPHQSTSVDMGVTLTNIGWLHYLKRNQQDALDAYHEALVLFRPLGDHRNTSTVMTQMGMVFVAQGCDDEAACIYEEALQMQRRVLGEHHEDVATTLLSLASTLERLQNWSRAIECLDSALQIRRQTVGPTHVQVGDILLQLGENHVRESNRATAKQSFAEALQVYKTAELDDCDARVQRALEALNGDEVC